jgi:hypothetical protein
VRLSHVAYPVGGSVAAVSLGMLLEPLITGRAGDHPGWILALAAGIAVVAVAKLLEDMGAP